MGSFPVFLLLPLSLFMFLFMKMLCVLCRTRLSPLTGGRWSAGTQTRREWPSALNTSEERRNLAGSRFSLHTWALKCLVLFLLAADVVLRQTERCQIWSMLWKLVFGGEISKSVSWLSPQCNNSNFLCVHPSLTTCTSASNGSFVSWSGGNR